MTEKFLFQDEEIFCSTYFTVSQDWETPIPGFFIISSNRKVRSISELNEEEAMELMKITIRIRKGMKDVLGIENVYLFQNEDTKHNFHLWMFPRHEWMEKMGSRIQSVKKIMNYAEQWIHNFDNDLHQAREILGPKNSPKQRDEIISEVRNSAAKMREYMKMV